MRRRWDAAGRKSPAAILDFGTGVGASLPHLARMFSDASLTALDVSRKSLAVAQTRGVAAEFVCYEGDRIPLPEGKFDLGLFTIPAFSITSRRASMSGS